MSFSPPHRSKRTALVLVTSAAWGPCFCSLLLVVSPQDPRPIDPGLNVAKFPCRSLRPNTRAGLIQIQDGFDQPTDRCNSHVNGQSYRNSIKSAVQGQSWFIVSSAVVVLALDSATSARKCSRRADFCDAAK
jgi:hypothetical protein